VVFAKSLAALTRSFLRFVLARSMTSFCYSSTIFKLSLHSQPCPKIISLPILSPLAPKAKGPMVNSALYLYASLEVTTLHEMSAGGRVSPTRLNSGEAGF